MDGRIWLRGCRVSITQQSDGGAEGNRTPDLLGAIQALSHLSYGP